MRKIGSERKSEREKEGQGKCRARKQRERDGSLVSTAGGPRRTRTLNICSRTSHKQPPATTLINQTPPSAHSTRARGGPQLFHRPPPLTEPVPTQRHGRSTAPLQIHRPECQLTGQRQREHFLIEKNVSVNKSISSNRSIHTHK